MYYNNILIIIYTNILILIVHLQPRLTEFSSLTPNIFMYCKNGVQQGWTIANNNHVLG